MYEEEDDLPARYQALMNNPLFALSPRASAYAITQMGMRDAVAARYSNRDPSRLDEVNRQFAQVFPGFGMPLQQTSLCEPGTIHGPTASAPHPAFSQQAPVLVTSPHTPVTQIHQPGLHHSPQNAALNSPFSSPDLSRVDSPASANPRTPGHTMQSPTTGLPTHSRSMSMSQVESMHMKGQVPGMALSVATPRAAGQRRSYDDAFSDSQSPLTTPAFSGAYPLLSPGMPPPPAAYNSNFQRHGSIQHMPMSPSETHPMHAAGFTTQLPANVKDFFMPQPVGRNGSQSGPRKSLCTPLHSTPTTRDAGVTSNPTQGQFQLKDNLRQVQREKKERKRRNTQDNQEGTKAEATANGKTKSTPKPSARTSVNMTTDYRPVKGEPVSTDDELKIKHDRPLTGDLAFRSLGDAQQDSTTESASTYSYSTSGSSTDNFDDVSLDLNNFHAYNAADFNNLETFNMNFEDNFDMNQFFTFPASQPENDNAQVAS